MSSLPIACTLTASDLAAVKERYGAAAGHYRANVRISGDHADIALTGDKPALHELLNEMIERESGCCSFLAFALAETAHGYDVRLSVLEGSELAHGILSESVAILFPAATLLTS